MHQVLALPWLTPPPAAALARARSLLLGLGALQQLAPRPSEVPLGRAASSASSGERGGGSRAGSSGDGSGGGSGARVTITAHGLLLAALPTHPRLAHILMQAAATDAPIVHTHTCIPKYLYK